MPLWREVVRLLVGRLGALLLRLAHRLIYLPHAGLVYVDDFLFGLQRQTAIPFALLVLALLCAVGTPLSWNKLQFGASGTWLGFEVSLLHEYRVSFPARKLERLCEILKPMLKQVAKVNRDCLEAGVGFLGCATGAAPMLRPFLHSVYKCLRSPLRVLRSLTTRQLAELYDCVDEWLIVQRSMRSADILAGWRSQSVGAHADNRKGRLADTKNESRKMLGAVVESKQSECDGHA